MPRRPKAQLPLWAQPSQMGQAVRLLTECQAILAAQLDRRGGPRNGHLPACRIGQWVDGHSGPDGAPCSKRCRDHNQLLDRIEQFLERL